VRLDNEVQATAYEAKIARLSCEELFERAEHVGDEFRALEPQAWLGGVQGAVVKRALACDGPLPALLVFRYLPYVVEGQFGPKTAVAAYTSLSTPETRPRALSALCTLLQAHDAIEGAPAGGDDWWAGRDDVFRPEDVIAPTCAELRGLRPGGERSYVTVKRDTPQ
jgi:hypothetical protein